MNRYKRYHQWQLFIKKKILKKRLSDVLLKKKVEKDHHCLILFCWAILLTIYLPVCPIPKNMSEQIAKFTLFQKVFQNVIFGLSFISGAIDIYIFQKKKCIGDFISSFCYAAMPSNCFAPISFFGVSVSKQSNPNESQNIKELKNLYSRTLKLEKLNPNSGSE